MTEPKTKTLRQLWAEYLASCAPKGAGPMQVAETRKAFYAGTAAMAGIHIRIADDNVSEDEAAAILEAVYQEIADFRDDLRSTGCECADCVAKRRKLS